MPQKSPTEIMIARDTVSATTSVVHGTRCYVIVWNESVVEVTNRRIDHETSSSLVATRPEVTSV